jgi:hypothetical protein
MLKKVTAAVALTGLMAGLAYAGQLPKSGINGSLHDMNAVVGATPDAFLRSCVFCHTPHNAATGSVDPQPLWNRSDSTLSPAAYGWVAPANLTIAIGDPLIGPSRLCASCHDGSIAVDSHNTNKATVGGLKLGATNPKRIADLTITHPIGFVYSEAVTARPGELVDPAVGFLDAPSSKLSSVVNAAGYSFNTHDRTDATLPKSSVKIADTLYSGYMTCASCHDVHNTTNAASDTGKSYNYFLRAREEGSAICLSCHIK